VRQRSFASPHGNARASSQISFTRNPRSHFPFARTSHSLANILAPLDLPINSRSRSLRHQVVFGGCCEAVDLTKDRSGVNSIQSALEDCYVFHLGGDLGFTDVTTYSGEVAEGDGLWVRVPGDSGLGLGRRVCPAAAVTSGGIMIFGGCRGKDDEEEKPGIFARGEGGDKKMLKDARIVAVKGMLNLNLAT